MMNSAPPKLTVRNDVRVSAHFFNGVPHDGQGPGRPVFVAGNAGQPDILSKGGRYAGPTVEYTEQHSVTVN